MWGLRLSRGTHTDYYASRQENPPFLVFFCLVLLFRDSSVPDAERGVCARRFVAALWMICRGALQVTWCFLNTGNAGFICLFVYLFLITKNIMIITTHHHKTTRNKQKERPTDTRHDATPHSTTPPHICARKGKSRGGAQPHATLPHAMASEHPRNSRARDAPGRAFLLCVCAGGSSGSKFPRATLGRCGMRNHGVCLASRRWNSALGRGLGGWRGRLGGGWHGRLGRGRFGLWRCFGLEHFGHPLMPPAARGAAPSRHRNAVATPSAESARRERA